MKLKALWILGFLLVTGNNQAQMNNNQYHQHQQRIQNRNHVAEQNRQGYMAQQRQMQQEQMQQQSPQPTGWWETTWGALAPSPVGGVLGVAVGASSKEEAESRALADCKSKGGGACEVLATYFNQCGAMALGAERIFGASAGTEKSAGEEAVRYCEQEEGADANCRVYYSACTEPVFHKY
ncbi:DUF4189 domain-containing protein [Marilutibacter alkalisoli]|uniref:DUF4189 domain-containing protein n=1 Tax=Marilutibacter alkalisoli TaxID=2591633 RepID=A0A514BVA8_9GAMM|nr:DUF4189 domain-containing protein [Lysobacter alkalisoli]QDH71343.1 DUF4189 domain-containing protein [Lysobacter alkalisoli]